MGGDNFCYQYLLPLTKTYGRINYVFLPASEGFAGISFALP